MMNHQDDSVTVEALTTMRLQAMLRDWETLPPIAQPDFSVLARLEKIIPFLACQTSEQAVAGLRADAVAKDSRAVTALVAIVEFLERSCGELLVSCAEQERAGHWQAVSYSAAFFTRVAEACNQHGYCANASFLRATALRALGNNRGTAEDYAQSIAEAEKAGDLRLLASAHDNIGNVLSDLGRFNEALQHYREAYQFEADPAKKRIVLSNQAGLLARLGEWRSASSIHLAQVQQIEGSGVTGTELGRALDNAAQAINNLGESATALATVLRARTLFAPKDLKERAVNALIEAQVHSKSGNRSGAAEAFTRAHDLAFVHARRDIDPAHYERGFQAALAASLLETDKANLLLMQGLFAKEKGDTDGAFKHWEEGVNQAREAADHSWPCGSVPTVQRC